MTWIPTKAQIKSWLSDPELLAWVEQQWAIFPDAPPVQPILADLISEVQADPRQDCYVHPTTDERFTIGVNVLTWEVWILIETSTLITTLDWHKTLVSKVSELN